MQTKKCIKCKKELQLNNFYKRNDRRNKYYTKCKSCWSVYSRNYFLSHKDSINRMRREWNRLNKIKVKKNNIAYQLKYPNKNKEIKKKQYEKNKQNIFFKINANMGSAISTSLKGNKNSYHWEELIGYKLNDLIEHLERQFKTEMSWSNYGKWHIDHIRPISSFNFKSYKDEEFKQCWTLNNLQPLWAEENISKSNKILI